MPSVSETTTIPAPIDEVWPLLSDPALVAACIPGATLSPDQSDGLWRGSIRVKFGPTVAQFRGEAALTYNHTAKTCSIEGKGIDQRGASRALASGVVKATSAGAATTLDVNGEFSMTGPLETFANAGGVHVARALLGEFAANMAKLVAERRGSVARAAAEPAASEPAASATVTASTTNERAAPGPVAPPASVAVQSPPEPIAPVRPTIVPTPSPPAAEISGFRILWLAFKSWISSLFGKRT